MAYFKEFFGEVVGLVDTRLSKNDISTFGDEQLFASAVSSMYGVRSK